MTNLANLPLLKVEASIVPGEDDLKIDLAFLESVDGITFTARVGDLAAPAPLTSANVVRIFVPAATTASWPPGLYALTLVGTDGTFSRDLLAASSLVVGASAIPTVTTVEYGAPA